MKSFLEPRTGYFSSCRVYNSTFRLEFDLTVYTFHVPPEGNADDYHLGGTRMTLMTRINTV